MSRKPMRRVVEVDGARRDIERRKFLDRLIEADVIETIEQADAKDGRSAGHVGPTDATPLPGTVTVDDIADGWRAFDNNRTVLTFSRRLADDYARRSRHFAITAGLGALALAGATAVFVWASWSSARQPSASPVETFARTLPLTPSDRGPVPDPGDSGIAPATFRLIVDRSQPAEVVFPFELRADDALGVTSFLMIRGVPDGVIVSYAQPLSASVWVMPASALTSGRLSISTIAPQRFTVAVDALSADGIRYAAFEIDIAASE